MLSAGHIALKDQGWHRMETWVLMVLIDVAGNETAAVGSTAPPVSCVLDNQKLGNHLEALGNGTVGTAAVSYVVVAAAVGSPV